MRALRWSTPVLGYGGYGPFGAFRLTARGEARWHEPEADYAYIQLEVDDVEYNVGRR